MYRAKYERETSGSGAFFKKHTMKITTFICGFELIVLSAFNNTGFGTTGAANVFFAALGVILCNFSFEIWIKEAIDKDHV